MTDHISNHEHGGSSTSGANLFLVTYRGNLPSKDLLRQQIGIFEDCHTYIVATAALARLRDELAGSKQYADRGTQMVFHRFLRHVLNRKLLTRAEEQVALKRAAENLAQDPDHGLLLKHDVFTWRDALAMLAEQGLDLATNFPSDLRAQLVNSSVGELLHQFQSEYRRMQQVHSRQPFEEAAYNFLETEYQPTSIVVLEGFTFLTPLQKRFIEVCSDAGSTIYIVYPYRPEQSYGFAIMEQTYALYHSAVRQELDTERSTTTTDLDYLQQYLFADQIPLVPSPPSSSVVIEGHSHRHREVAQCIAWIQTYLREGIAPSNIAIVTRNGGEIQGLLQEEAQLRGLQDAQGNRVELGIPPRLLLLTPVGRFILTLYEIWQNGQLQMNADQFEALLVSGWLGGHLQATVEIYSAVRAQCFTRCQSENQWKASLIALRNLRRTLDDDSRLSAAGIDQKGNTIRLWEQTIDQIVRLCRRLFIPGEILSIGDHVRRLLDELTVLDTANMRQLEVEVLERIRAALQEVVDSDTLEMSAEEFGDVLNGLVSEYERNQEEPGEPPLEDENGNKTIWVTIPEGIDSYAAEYVFYLGIDDHRCPRPYVEPWPFYSHAIGPHQKKERYLFLAVVRAASKKLHLSYARLDREQRCRPSQYLQQSATLLGRSIQDVVEPGLITPLLPLSIPPRLPLRARRQSYNLAEIAHFALCPFRYKLESLDRGARRYRDEFQVRFLAQAVWLKKILTHLVETGGAGTGPEEIAKMLLDGMEVVRTQVEDDFPGLRELDWLTIRRKLISSLVNIADYWGQEKYLLGFRESEISGYVVNENDRVIQISVPMRFEIRRGVLLYAFLEDILFEEWLIPGSKPEEDTEKFIEVDGLKVFNTHYHAVQWWSASTRAAFKYRKDRDRGRNDYIEFQTEILNWIQKIEVGYYPKHQGEHCQYCPVRGDCLGLSEDEQR